LTADDTTLLAIITAPLTPEDVRWITERASGRAVTALCYGQQAEQEDFPPEWTQMATADVMDAEALRRDFLAFLDAWPRQPIVNGRSFDDVLRRRHGYSLWWTGPGKNKHPDKGVFLTVRTVWICSRAIEAVGPQRVLVCTRQQTVAAALASKCRNMGVACEFAPSSAGPAINSLGGVVGWWVSTLLWLVVIPWMYAVRAIMARLIVGLRRDRREDRRRPAIVLNSKYPRDYRNDEPVNWLELENALHRADETVRLRHLLQPSKVPRRGLAALFCLVYDPAWMSLRRIKERLSPDVSYMCLGTCLPATVRQLIGMWRYRRLEKARAFAESFEFVGADLAELYVPLLRRAVARMASWDYAVAAAAKTLRSAGTVAAFCVTEEMYESGMICIAAARTLKIPTVGVQHGTLFPMHLIYAIPPGQMAGTPTPDHFAVYGSYAADVLSKYGAFPHERIWVTGGPRFDALVNHPADGGEMRRSLDLPLDKRIVLVATQEYGWFLDAVRAVFEVAGHRPDLQIVVKARPMRDHPLTSYQQLAAEAGLSDVVFFLDQFNELLSACDVMVSGSSTTVFEAILLGKRTICVNFSDEPDRYPYVANGGSLPARNAKQMAESMRLALSDEAADQLEVDRRRFLAYHAGPTAQGKAAETMAARILSLGVGGPARAD